VLVDMKVAGLNYIDTYIRSGLYPNPAPHIMGREGSGVVREVGEAVSGLAEGDHVSFFAPGSYAEQAAVPATACVKMPADMEFSQGAAITLQGLTAHYLTRSTYELKSGDICLIHAGAGGTGRLMTQMAKLSGATVITTVGTEAKAEVAKSAGADHVINYSTQDFHAEVMKYTENKGVHVVYDGVGASTWEKSVDCLRRRGLLVLFGNASGPVPPINPLILSKKGSLFVTRPTLADYIAAPGEFNQRASELVGWVNEGKLEARIDKTFPLDKAADSHTYLESRAAMGKILLQIV
jgi:NADPH2:quinone reductase